jgi:hypothetical protein
LAEYSAIWQQCQWHFQLEQAKIKKFWIGKILLCVIMTPEKKVYSKMLFYQQQKNIFFRCSNMASVMFFLNNQPFSKFSMTKHQLLLGKQNEVQNFVQNLAKI